MCSGTQFTREFGTVGDGDEDSHLAEAAVAFAVRAGDLDGDQGSFDLTALAGPAGGGHTMPHRPPGASDAQGAADPAGGAGAGAGAGIPATQPALATGVTSL